MEFVCDIKKCTGCKACLEMCKVGALSFNDNVEFSSVKIDEDKCVKCGACKRVCQVNQPLELMRPFYWKQGWGDETTRNTSSSGGFASQIMKSFVSEKAYVCSCAFKDGEFRYLITNRMDELEQFKGSKYVKSNPEKIYGQIRELLKSGCRVLFIGLPCHVAALKAFLRGMYEDLLFSIDLICHGTPSETILKSFLDDCNFDIYRINKIAFREKNSFDIMVDAQYIVTKGTIDRYTLGFLRGLFYTENCYNCMYAQIDRISDLTLGDSWGTNLKDQEKFGISLALCQTEKGKFLLENSNLSLFDVDLQNAIRENHQLGGPSKYPKEREVFFAALKKTKSVNKAVYKCYPKDCIKQKIKGYLIKMHIWRENQ